MSFDKHFVSVALNALWDQQNISEINTILCKYLTADTQHHCILDLIAYSKSKKKPKSLGNLILAHVTKCFAGRNMEPIDRSVKEHTIDIALNCHTILAVNLIKFYQADKPKTGCLKSRILIAAKDNLNGAINIVTALKLQSEFSIFKLVLPAFLQNKVNLVDNYLRDCPAKQEEMAGLLDSWLDPEYDVFSFLVSHSLHSAKGDVLKRQYLEKTLSRWLKAFNKEEKIGSLCPNLCRCRGVSTLQYLLYRYYIQKIATFENTKELVMKTVEGNEYLQNELVKIVYDTYYDNAGGQYWEKVFNFNISNAPEPHQHTSDEEWGLDQYEADLCRKESSLTDSAFHKLKLAPDRIHIVSNDAELDCCDVSVLEYSEMVGIDAEWSFMGGKDDAMALLQLATEERIFLIDVPQFLRERKTRYLVSFLSKLFVSENIIKVGFGLKDDLKKLVVSLPELGPAVKSSVRVLDLHNVSNHMKQLYPDIFMQTSSSMQLSGLSKLVNQTLGQPLDKSEQISDWERRPLRPSQIRYAALDAYCLIEVFNVLSVGLAQRSKDLTLESVCRQPLSKISQSDARNKSNSSVDTNATQNSRVDTKPIAARNFRVVCDNMLQGLGRQLRCCGVDAEILSNDQSHDQCATLAQKDGRIILTSGAPCQVLSSHVPEGCCLNVPNDLKSKDQASLVLQHFNVHVTELDVFSRCQICNCGKYFKAKPDDMLEAIVTKQSGRVSHSSIPWDEVRKEIALTKKEDGSGGNLSAPSPCEEHDEVHNDFSSAGESDEDISSPGESVHSPQYKFSKIASDLRELTVKPQKKNATYNINPDSISSDATFDTQNGTIVIEHGKRHVHLLLDQVPKPVCNEVEEFYCCIGCGKVYWAGQHFGNVLEKYKHVLFV